MRLLSFLVAASAAGALSCGGLTTKLCGAPGQPCCSGECDANAKCGAQDLCEACGGEGQPCCAMDACSEPLACGSGACVAALSCEVNCTLGSTRCANNGVETCSPLGVCPAWKSTIAQCPAGSVCQAVTAETADCIESCPGACAPDTLLCTGEGLRRCVAQGPCPSLAPEPDDSDDPVCTTGGIVSAEWVWESPTPSGIGFVAVAGDLTSSFWALDVLGNILHYAIGPWEYEVRPTEGKRMQALASCGLGSRLYAAGEGGTVLRRAAAVWTEENVGASGVTLTAVACDSTRAYATGSNGQLYIREGSTWTGYPTGNTTGYTDLASMFSQQQVYLSGPGGLIVRCDVAALPPTCTTDPSGTTESLNALWGDTFTGTVYAAGNGGVLLERGASWQRVNLPGVTRHFTALGGWYDPLLDMPLVVASTEDGHVVIRRGGTTLDSFDLLGTNSIRDVWVPNEDHLYLASELGTLWHRDGVLALALPEARGGQKPVSESLYGVATVGQGRLFAVGDKGTRVRRQNGAWVVDALGAATTAALYGIAARSAGELYAVGEQGTVLVRRWGTWVREADGLTTSPLFAVALDTEHVWALGPDVLLEKDLATGAWRALTPPTGPPLRAMALRKGTDGKRLELALAGEDCRLFAYADGGFTPGPSDCQSSAYLSAAFLASGDLILGTISGLILRRTGGQLQLENVSAGNLNLEPWYGLVPDGATMWAVGEVGLMFRRVATGWVNGGPDITNTGMTAGVRDDEGLFLVGHNGTILRKL